MDSKPQMPDIKPEVNREDDKRASSGGLLSKLFGGGGATGSAGGAAGGAAGAATGGGLLATKAGLVAMVLIGTSVAGGIGLTGYRMFGPTAADRAGGGNIEVFSAKPRAAAPAEGGAAATGEIPNGGASGSLDMMSQAAGKDAPEEAKPAGDAATDAAAASAAATQTAGTSNGPINAGGSATASASAFRNLAGTKKLGELSKNFAGGGSAPSSGGAGSKPVFDSTAYAAAKAGATSAMNRGSGAGVMGGRAAARRAGSGGSGRSAMGQLRGVNGANAGYGGGSHAAYDGGSANGIAGEGGSAISMEGAGAGSGESDKAIKANSAGNENKFEPPKPKEYDSSPPWQSLMDQMQIAVMLLGALAAIATLIEKVPPPAKWYTLWKTMLLGALMMGIAAWMTSIAVKLGDFGDISPKNVAGMAYGFAGAAAIIGGLTMAQMLSKEGEGSMAVMMVIGMVTMGLNMVWGQQVSTAEKKYADHIKKKQAWEAEHPNRDCPLDKVSC